MKTIVEIHALQNFAPSNLNRDDTGAPKDALFGGTRRARVSSQCSKRAVRGFFDSKISDGIFGQEELADRTKRLFGELKQRVAAEGRQGDAVEEKVERALNSMGLKLKGEKTQYLLFLGRAEIENLADRIHEKWDEIGDPVVRISAVRRQLEAGLPQGEGREQRIETIFNALKIGGEKPKIKEEELVAIENGFDELLRVLNRHFGDIQSVESNASGKEKKRKKSEMSEWESEIVEILKDGKDGVSALGKSLLQVLDGGKAVDVALFGRMLANMPEKNQHAACQVAHAISTHAVEREFDFYTAVDDLKPEDNAGADMMGTVEFNSACFYRYAVVDWDKLVSNLQGDNELATKGLRAFLEGFVISEPTGKQNTFAAHNPPEFVAVSVRHNAAPRNLANAFEAAVRVPKGESLTAKSAEALVGKANVLNGAFGGDGSNTYVLNLTGVALDGFGSKVDSLATLLDKIIAAIKE